MAVNIQGWVPQRPDSRDHHVFSSLPHLLGASTPISFPSLTKGMKILDQSNLGSCTAHSTGKAFRFLDYLYDSIDFDISELFQYYNSRMLMGPQYVSYDSGATIRDAAKAAATYGMSREEMWGYDISRFTQKPPEPAYEYAQKHSVLEYVSVPVDRNTIQAVIASGRPIINGFTVYENYQQGFSTGIWPEAAGKVVGGHSTLYDGYDDWGVDFPNSWGTSVGKAGWFRQSWNFVLNNASDLWTFNKVSPDAVIPPPTPDPVLDLKALAAKLTVEQMDQLFIYKHGPVDKMPIIFEDGYTWPTRIDRPDQMRRIYGRY